MSQTHLLCYRMRYPIRICHSCKSKGPAICFDEIPLITPEIYKFLFLYFLSQYCKPCERLDTTLQILNCVPLDTLHILFFTLSVTCLTFLLIIQFSLLQAENSQLKATVSQYESLVDEYKEQVGRSRARYSLQRIGRQLM